MDKEKLKEKLCELNKQVEEAVRRRTLFLDKNMKFFAEFQIGEKVYNCITKQVGVCSDHYRYHAGHIQHDNSLSCDCYINEPPGSYFYDDTLRFMGFHPWVKYEEYEKTKINR